MFIENESLEPPIGKINNCFFYICSLKKLIEKENIQLWEGQRSLDNERVTLISETFLNEYKKTGTISLRGSLIFCKKNDLIFSEKLYLIDGQHRFYSLKYLIENNKIPDIKIRLDIILVKDENEIRKEFVNINKSVPVPVHYLTPNDIVTLCFNQLSKDFSKAFSQGNCKRPTINSDSFKDALINKSNFLNKLEINNSDELYNAIIKLNNYYKKLGSEKLQDIIARKNKNERRIVSNCFEKCLDGDHLFLGLFKEPNWTVDLMNIS